MTERAKTVVFCNCSHSSVTPQATRHEVLEGLSAAGIEIIGFDDLCGAAARRDERLVELADAQSVDVIACRPRALKWLLHRGGARMALDSVRFFDMHEERSSDILAAVLAGKPPLPGRPAPDLAAKGDWIPWFPVIDYDRCVNCAQCLNFCLFGVYAQDDGGRVVVANPANCKTNCPACARICPQVAIIFPKCGETPIDGSAVDERALDGRVKVDIRERLGADAYEALRQRRKTAKRRLLKQAGDPSDGKPFQGGR